MTRLLSPFGCLVLACLATGVGARAQEKQGTAPAEPFSPVAGELAGLPAAGELAGLPEAARVALGEGRVVLLETVAEDNVLATKLVAVVRSRPEGVVDALRDYEAMRAFPEVRRVQASKGEARDTFELTVKPHPLLPPMDFTKAVEWSLDGQGTTHVGMTLLSTTSSYVADQVADYRILPLDEDSSLVFYEARSTYAKLSFRNKVLRRMCESSEKWLADVQGRAAARTSDKPGAAGAIALLSTGAVAAPLR